MNRNLIFELSVEVCYQMGGIYRVIHSKIPSMVRQFGHENYCLIGPFVPIEYEGIFEEYKNREQYEDEIGRVVTRLKDEGVDIHYGRWLVEGTPRVVLINPYQEPTNFEQIKRDFCNLYECEFFERNLWPDLFLSFGYRVSVFFQYLTEMSGDRINYFAHFHECHTACGLLNISTLKLPVKTIFTTHSTIVGRWFAHKLESFYVKMRDMNSEKAARKLPPTFRFSAQIERMAARHCDVFTTVSNIMGEECRLLLGRQPDVITMNGLNANEFKQIIEEARATNGREIISEFITKHFSKYYKIDLSKTFIFFTAGRYEYKNKGYDTLIKSLGSLNKLLKKQKSTATVVVFFITNPPFMHVTRYRKFFNSVSEFVRKIISAPRPDVLSHSPGLSIEHCEIFQAFRANGLQNKECDNVKVVFHPEYLSRQSPALKIDYLPFVRSSDLGIFPSYYEPWGYTAAECISLGVPSVISNVSGLGTYLADHPMENAQEIFLLNRKQREQEAVSELTNYLWQFTQKPRLTIAHTDSNVDVFDWSRVFTNYEKAYA